MIESESESCSVLSDSLWPHSDCIVHGTFQARILEWVAYPFSSGSSWPRNLTGIEPGSPAMQEDSLPTELSGKSEWMITLHNYIL